VIIYVTDAADLKLCLILHLFAEESWNPEPKRQTDGYVRKLTFLESESAACQTAVAAVTD